MGGPHGTFEGKGTLQQNGGSINAKCIYIHYFFFKFILGFVSIKRDPYNIHKVDRVASQ